MTLEFKTIKLLGSGGNGSVYLVEYKDEYLIYKIEKMDVYNEHKPLTSEYYRQIKFNKDIAIKYPDKFMILRAHGIIYNCDYKHPDHEMFMREMNEKRKKRYIRKNSQSNCYFLLYSPYLENSYMNVRKKIVKNPKLFLDFMYQIITSINIIRKAGYSQNDCNPNNLMFKMIDGHYQWYIIDYGNMYNPDFPLSALDKDINDRAFYGHDLLQFMETCISPNFFKFIKDHKLNKNIEVIKFIENVQNENKYDDYIKYLPKNIKNKKNTLLRLIITILNPILVLKCLGASYEISNEYTDTQLYPELMLYCIKHYEDKNYDKILKKIELLQKAQDDLSGGYKILYLQLKKQLETIN